MVGTLGAGSALAALCVKYRDFRYILPFLLQILLFVSPVIYPITYADAAWVPLVLALNPLSGAIGLFRGMFSDAPINPALVCISSASAGILFVLGLVYFRRTEAYFSDLA
jgi:lipopolysaccharide transport system permease protein